MSRRWFTSDFHLNMVDILRYENRPYASISDMNNAFVKMCEDLPEDDIVIHIGDLYSFGLDRGSETHRVKPNELLHEVKATFVNIRGNHDLNNKVKSLCESMQLRLGKRYPSVIAAHYPSYDKRALDYVKDGCILLCGHVHSRWKHCLDLDHNVLNVNVGVDVNRYRLVSEEDLVKYLNRILTHNPTDLYRCKTVDG